MAKNSFVIDKSLSFNPITTPTNPSEGDMYKDVTDGKVKQYRSGNWINVNSDSELNSILSQDFENAVLGNFTQTGMELISSPFIHGAKTARLIHQASSTYSFKEVRIVDPKFKGRNLTLKLNAMSTALSSNVTVTVIDETNDPTGLNPLVSSTFTTGQINSAVFNTTNASNTVNITDNSILNGIQIGASITGSAIPTGTIVTNKGTGTITISNNAIATATGVSLKVSSLPNTQAYSFDAPSNCSSISYTISALQEAELPETYVDDITIELTQIANTTTSITVPKNNDFDNQIQNGITIGAVTTAPTKGATAIDRIVFSKKGNMLFAKYDFQLSGYGSSGSGDYLISLPTGVQFDSTIQPFSGSITSTTSDDLARAYLGEGVMFSGTSDRGYVKAFAYDSTRFRIITLNLNSTLINGTTTWNSGNFGMGSYAVGLTVNIQCPISGWTSNETETKTIPLTSSVLVTEPDSYLQMNGFSVAAGSSATRVLSLASPTYTKSEGNAIKYVKDSVNGDYIEALLDGQYHLVFNYDSNLTSTTNSGLGFSKNSNQLSTEFQSINPEHQLSLSYSLDVARISWSGPLKSGDKVRIHSGGGHLASAGTVYSQFSVSYQGSTKILNPSSDQKVEIPTHELRFEGASSRGSVATAIVKFDTMAKIKGDGFEVVNTAADGTYVRIKKAGKLDVSTSFGLPANNNCYLTKNSTQLTGQPTIVADILGFSSSEANALQFVNMNWSGEVLIGDIIRVHSTANLSNASSSLNISLQETSVSVALQNVTPRWDDSDSAVRVQGANGFGSTNTFVRRFSSVVNNTGTSVTYADSATLGASFTVNETGLYDLSYTDAAASNQIYMAITKNQINQTIGSNIIVAGSANGSNSNDYDTISNQEYLVKGDVIRAVVNIPANAASTNSFGQFSISKVGKTQGTVDVTPFVQIPQNEVHEILFGNGIGFGSSWTNNRRFGSPIKNTNNGVIRIVDDASFGTYFEALKPCEIYVTYGGPYNTDASPFLAITINQSSSSIGNQNEQIALSQFSINLNYCISGSRVLSVGDRVRVGARASTFNTSIEFLSIVAKATSPSIATPTQQVSSDTMNFVFKSTTIVDSDPIGTFNTYWYTSNTNNMTLGTNPPTQSISSMNQNGIRVFGRAYTAVSSEASPPRVAIKIGKGLSGQSVRAYVNTGKSLPLNIDNTETSDGTTESGTRVFYDENTGILTIDAGMARRGANSVRYVGMGFTNGSMELSGYFVFNASQSPSLVSIPNLAPRIAIIKDVKPNNTNGGSSVATTWTARELNTVDDPTGLIKQLSANTITLGSGTYLIRAISPYNRPADCKTRIYNTSFSIVELVSDNTYGATASDNTWKSHIAGHITLTAVANIQLQYWVLNAYATIGLGETVTGSGNTESDVYSMVEIQKVK